MKKLLLALLLLVACPASSHAHFIWLVSDAKSGTPKLHVYFGEAAEPDDPALLAKVANAEVWLFEGRGEPKSVTLKKSADALTGELSQATTAFARHTYGVAERGGEAFLLKYYAKSYPFELPGTWRTIKDKERLPLEVTPAVHEQGTQLSVTWQGEPVADATVTVVGPGIREKLEGTTDAAGKFLAVLPEAGLYSIRARFVETKSGNHDGKDYKSIRHYSTLSLPFVPSQVKSLAHELPALPKGTTSFGGAVIGDTLFVYGGNYGSSHVYANEDQSGDLWGLDLKKPSEWQKLSGGPKLQGLTMVAYRGQLYRVGGFVATNKSQEPQNLVSQADCARYSPQSGAWQSLPGLPEPRSSHDAAVVGDTLYVVGGWNMQGGSKTAKWHETALAMQLSADMPAWRTIAPPPFQRRALALAAWRDKLYCVGGMQDQGSPTPAVAVYDPANNSWSTAPSLLGGDMEGFGSSAFACQDALYVTTVSGSIQRLHGDARQWEYVGQVQHPRFFHRLLPWQDAKLLVVGGANMEQGKTEALEVLAPAAQAAAAK